MKNKFFKTIAVLVSSVAILFCIIACEVGLGAAVDTAAPTVEISYPPKNAVIRDSFLVSGTCDDDLELDRVEVLVTESTTKTNYGPYLATLSNENKAWSVTLNQKTNGNYDAFTSYKQWEFPDGSYIITVYSYDKVGNASQEATIPVDIDNTAPVLLVSKPLAVGTENASVFGRTLNIIGDISEAHETTKLTLNYLDTQTGAVTPLEISGFGTMSSDNPLVIAKLDKSSAEATNSVLTRNYEKIYGAGSIDLDNLNNYGKKLFYCGFLLEDSAKLYVNSSDSGSGEGNQTTQYYILSDDFNDNLFSENAYSLNARNLMLLLNGQSSYSEGQITSITQKLKKTGNTASSQNITSAQSSKFSIDPKNNPTWAITNFELNEGNFGTYEKGSAVPLVLKAGGDGIAIDKNSIEIKLYHLGNGDSPSEIDGNTPYLTLVRQGEYEDGKLKVALNPSNENSLVFENPNNPTLDDKTLRVNHYYEFRVTGTDISGNDIESEGGRYGFRLYSNSAAPKVTFVTENGFFKENEYKSGKELDDTGIKIKGKIITAKNDIEITGVDKIKVSGITVSDTSTGTDVSSQIQFDTPVISNLSVTSAGSATDGKEYTFEALITKKTGVTKTLQPSTEGSYKYEVGFVAEDSLFAKNEASVFEFKVDNKAPEIPAEEIDATPTVTKAGESKVNGTVTVSGVVSDTGSGLKKLYWGINVEDDADEDDLAEISDASSPWSISVNTLNYNGSALTDNQAHTLKVFAIDSVGNRSFTSYSLNVEQDTDLPVISFTNNTAMFTKTNNKLAGSITDDDGLKTITAKYKKVSPVGGADTDIVLGTFTQGTTSYGLSIPLPQNEEGEYDVTVTATDVPNLAKGTNTKTVRVTKDHGAPEFKITTSSSAGKWYNGDVSISGTVKDGSGTATITRQIYKVVLAADGTESSCTPIGNATTLSSVGTAAEIASSNGKAWTDTINVKTAINTNGLTNGTYKVVYSAKDKYATSVEDDTHTNQKEIYFSIDIEKPEVKTVNIKNSSGSYVALSGYYNKNEGNFKVTVNDSNPGSGISSVQYNKSLVEGNAQNVWKNMSGSGNEWTAEISFNDASIEKTFYLRAIDKAGNASADDAYPVIIKMDTTAPLLTVASTGTNSLSGNVYVNKEKDITFTGTYTEGSNDENESGLNSLQFTIGNIPVTGVTVAQTGATYTATIPASSIPEEGGLFTLTGTDKATNATSVMPCTFIFDNTKPDIKDIKLPAAYKKTAEDYYFRRKDDDGNPSAALTIEGSATDNGGLFDKIELYLNDIKKDENTSSPWSFSLDLASETDESAESAVVLLKAYDKAGNIKQEGITISFDETKPEILSEEEDAGYSFRNLGPVKKDKNILLGGGRYSEYTYDSATSVDFEVNLKEAGSGIEKLEYKLFSKQTSEPVFDDVTSISGNLSPVSDTSGEKIKYTATISGFEPVEEGKTNYLLLRPTDNCGNIGSVKVLVVNVDQKTPTVTAVNKEYLTNGTKHITITGSSYDVDAGIKALRIILNNDKEHPVLKTDGDASNNYGTLTYTGYAPADPTNVTTTPTGATYTLENAPSYVTWTLELTPENGSWFNNAGSMPVISIQAEDWAGNIAPTPVKVATLKKDSDKPVIDSVSPASNERVNGSVTITGTTSDETSTPEKLVLSWATTENGSYTQLQSKEVGVDGVSVSDLYNFSFTENFYNTKYIADNEQEKVIWLKLVATDAAGNNSLENKLKYTIDRDTDRPEITISGVSLEGKTSANPAIIQEDKLDFSITDDDGQVTDAWYKVNSAANWTALSLNEGSGSITLDLNGQKTIEFKITDKSGKTFYSKKASGEAVKDWDRIKLNGTTESILYAVLDNEDPIVSIKKIYIASKENPADTDWNEWTDEVLGGATKKVKFELSIKEDGSGIKDDDGVVANVLLNNDAVADYSFDTTFIKTDTDGNKIYNVTLPCTKEHKINADTPNEKTITIGDGTITIQLVATDKSGRTGLQDKSFPIDNTQPEINVTSPVIGKEQSGSIIVKGGVNETVSLSYAVSTLEASPDTYTSLPSTYTKVDPETGNEVTNQSYEGNPSASLADLYAYKPYSSASLNSFYIYFDGSDAADNHTGLLNTWLKNLGVTTEARLRAESNAFADLVILYLHLKASDAAGNESHKAYPIIVDPQGDRPKIDFSYPVKTGETLGGTINVIGSINGKSSSYTVYLQIDCDGDGDYDDVDINYLKTKGYPTADFDSIPGLTGQKGIKIPVSGTVWSKKLNATNEFNPDPSVSQSLDANGRRIINIRAYAYDSQLSSAKTRKIYVDSKVPVIDQDVKLVQWTSGHDGDFTVADTTGKLTFNNYQVVREYSDGMSITGKWYVVGLVHDDSGITKIKLGEKNTNFENEGTELSSTAQAGALIKSYTVEGKTNYAFCFPVGSASADAVGKSEVNFYALEGSEEKKSVQRLFTVNYDNKKPEVKNPIQNTENASLPIIIFNEDGFYNFGTDAFEESVSGVNQSGVERIAFYFTREITSGSVTTKTVFDPMIRVGKTGNSTIYSASDLSQGLIWKSAEVSNVSHSELTLSSVPAYVHKGGLAKVNGSIYLIKGVTSSTVTLDGNPGDATSALFAIANVIDTTYAEEIPADVETKKTDYGYGYPDSDVFEDYDDGDLMPESCIASGSKWTWDATINSKNISDGMVKLHYVVFDKAGNYIEHEVEGKVQNNAPRLAGAWVGTDEDGNGTVEESEMVKYHYHDKGMNGIKKVDTLTVPEKKDGEAQTSAIKLKRKTLVKPEVVGGNGELYYTCDIGETNSKRITRVINGSSTTLFDMNVEGNADSDDSAYGQMTIEVIDLLNKEIADGQEKFTFTIWDSTPGLTAGTDSQSATLNVYMDVALDDTIRPKNKIIPFYWKSAEENSIGQNGGHIELSKDWTVDTTGSGENAKVWSDKDPKVSGNIKLEGIAQDNSLLKELSVTIGSKTFTIATYNEVGWSEKSGTGWSAEIKRANFEEFIDAGKPGLDESGLEDDKKLSKTNLPEDMTLTSELPYASQNYGHVVHWIMYIDTKAIDVGKTLPAADVAITVSAKDYGWPSKSGNSVAYSNPNTLTTADNDGTASPALSGGNDGTAVHTCKYQMDVVPYITRIKTALSDKSQKTDTSEYDRTALGHYPVRTNEEIIITGYNLGGTVNFTSSDASSATKAYSASGVAIPANAKSGAISITNNNIDSLNNKNSNSAHGQYEIAEDPERDAYGEKNTYTAFLNYYNRKPNKQNNYSLTDDTVLDIWQINSRAAKPANTGNISDPIMKINPNNGMIGFAYQSGARRFSMANETKSYKYWIMDWDNLSATGFAYDSAGNTFATACGGDINNAPSVSKFVLMSSRWGDNTSLNDDGALGAAGNGNAGGDNAMQFEQIGQIGKKDGTNTSTNYIDKTRFVSPSIAVSGSGGSAKVYLAYYDKMNKEIRFRWAANPGTTTAGFTGTTHIKDQYLYGNLGSNGNNDKYNTKDFQIIAETEKAAGSTSLGTPGPYVAIDVLPNAGGSGNAKYDIVVLVWYDEANNELKYTYNTTDLSKVTTGFNGSASTGSHWEKAAPIFSDAGQYCQIKADAKGGIHIAAYDSKSGDVCYAKLDSYSGTANTCIVDSNGIVGSNLTLDVALDADNGFAIPYISYYGSVGPKLAYLTEFGKAKAAEDGNTIADAPGTIKDMFTGYWEVTEIPSEYNVPKDRINVGVWKTKKTDSNDTGGAIDNSISGETKHADEAGDTSGNGETWGNGTSNPVVAYEIRPTSATGFMETAQKK